MSMSDRHEYRLKIGVVSVASLPMCRLAEYMSELARLLGEQEHVHFLHVEPGSAVLVAGVEDPAVVKVGERLRAVRDGCGARDAMQAYKALDGLLAKDNAVGTLFAEGGAEVIAFPGCTGPKPLRYGPFREEGSLDGVVIRVGGRDETIPVLLKDAGGAEYPCQTNLELSKKLAQLYRGPTVRVYGSGKWVREENGAWTLQQFDITSFDVLDDAPLTDVVAKLRAVEGAGWNSDASLGDMPGLRREDGPAH
jgi:hypothetical protein